MPQLLVTGATGLAGSNVCKLAAARGLRVRALVRSRTGAEALLAFGAELVEGDITDPASLEAAMRSADFVIHCAAQIGGSWSTATAQNYEAVNQWGSINVLAAAERLGVRRTVMLATAVLFDRTRTLAEDTPIVPISDRHSPYTRTKLAAFYEGMARAARGQEVVFVVPGGIYGPSPIASRALVPTCFTHTLLRALRGELKRYLDMPMPWVFARDVANVALLALERGTSGARYLACGRPEDCMSLPDLCNRALALAGRAHRVENFDATRPGAANDAEFGTMLKYMLKEYPDPLLDCRRTTEALGFAPTPADEGLLATLKWLEEQGQL